MNKGFTQQTGYAYKTPRRKQAVLLPAVPAKPTHTAEGSRQNPNCYGCWAMSEPHPSQRYHMQEGGCLYDESLATFHKSVLDAVATDLGKN